MVLRCAVGTGGGCFGRWRSTTRHHHVRPALEATRAQLGDDRLGRLSAEDRIRTRLERFAAGAREQLLAHLPARGLDVRDPGTYPESEPSSSGGSLTGEGEDLLRGAWLNAHRAVALSQAMHVSAAASISLCTESGVR